MQNLHFQLFLILFFFSVALPRLFLSFAYVPCQGLQYLKIFQSNSKERKTLLQTDIRNGILAGKSNGHSKVPYSKLFAVNCARFS